MHNLYKNRRRAIYHHRVVVRHNRQQGERPVYRSSNRYWLLPRMFRDEHRQNI